MLHFNEEKALDLSKQKVVDSKEKKLRQVYMEKKLDFSQEPAPRGTHDPQILGLQYPLTKTPASNKQSATTQPDAFIMTTPIMICDREFPGSEEKCDVYHASSAAKP